MLSTMMMVVCGLTAPQMDQRSIIIMGVYIYKIVIVLEKKTRSIGCGCFAAMILSSSLITYRTSPIFLFGSRQ